MMVDTLELTAAREAAEKLETMQEAAAKLPGLEAAAAAEAEAARLAERSAKAAGDLDALTSQYLSALSSSNARLAELVDQFDQVVTERRRVAGLAKQLLGLARVAVEPGLYNQPGLDPGSSPAEKSQALADLAHAYLEERDLWPMVYDRPVESRSADIIQRAVNAHTSGLFLTRVDPSNL